MGNIPISWLNERFSPIYIQSIFACAQEIFFRKGWDGEGMKWKAYLQRELGSFANIRTMRMSTLIGSWTAWQHWLTSPTGGQDGCQCWWVVWSYGEAVTINDRTGVAWSTLCPWNKSPYRWESARWVDLRARNGSL